MKWLALFAVLLSTVFARAAAYTGTCPHMTMHVGDLVTPALAIYKITSSAGASVGAGSAIFATPPPPCTLTATSSSPVGNYTSTMNTGTLANPGTDTITYVNGTTAVIAPDGIGATLTDSIAFPPGFFSAPAYGAINGGSNNICVPVGDGVTVNTDCLNYLQAFSRGAQASQGTCNGTTTLTWVSGTNYSGMTVSSDNSAIYIAGVVYNVASVTSATTLALTTNCPTQTNVVVRLPRMHVSAVNGSTTITWVEGPTFTTAAFPVNTHILIGNGNYFYQVSSVTDATHIVLTAAFAQATNANLPFYNSQRFNTTGSGDLPLYVFLPAGNYLTDDTINIWGNYNSIWGVGPSTHLILKANSPPFNTGSTVEWIQQPTITNADGFHIFIRNISFEIQPGNPNAEIAAFVPNNFAAMRNDLLYADDSSCVAALNMSRNLTGPGMLFNVDLRGCATGLLGGNITYNITGENLTAEAQTTVGVSNNQNKMQLRHVLFDEGAVPCMTNTNAASSAVLINSECRGTGALAFQNSSTAVGNTSTFYFKADTVTGYTTSVNDYGSGTLVSSTGNIVEQWTGAAISPFDSGLTPHSLGLPIQETPQANDPAASGWGVLSDADPSLWNASLAACTSTTYYTPPGQIPGTGAYTATVPDCVNHLQFFDAMPTPGKTYTINLTVAGSSATPLIIEDCPQSQCIITHTGTRTVVLLDSNTANYLPGTGAGNLFCDDAILGGGSGPVTFAAGQSIWCRQLDQEQTTASKLACPGATLWILGYKTEHNGDLLDLSSGCQAEIYGGSWLGDPPSSGTGGTMFSILGSSLFATGSEINQGGAEPGFQYWACETRGSLVCLTIPGAENANENLGMLYSYGAQNTSINTVGGSAVIGGASAVQ